MTRVGTGWGLLLIVAGACAAETVKGQGTPSGRPPVTRAAEPTTKAEREPAAEAEPERAELGDEARSLEDRTRDRDGLGGIVASVMAREPEATAPAEGRREPRSTIPAGAPPDVAAPPPAAKTTASGLAYRVLTPGTGTVRPGPRDEVEVHYTGWTTDGKEFDSSTRRGRTASFGVDEVIPGWTEGLQLMVEGETTRFWIPEELAYKGGPGRPAGMLVFDVELIHIAVKPPPPAVPVDVAAPSTRATVTKSGLAYEVLTPGTGTTHPAPTSRVEVHYTGWTTDGKMFDSSVVRGKTATFPLNAVIEGWTEGLQLMVVGEKTRFWIPEGLAYRGKAGRPAGMLVFDVELVGIS